MEVSFTFKPNECGIHYPSIKIRTIRGFFFDLKPRKIILSDEFIIIITKNNEFTFQYKYILYFFVSGDDIYHPVYQIYDETLSLEKIQTALYIVLTKNVIDKIDILEREENIYDSKGSI